MFAIFCKKLYSIVLGHTSTTFGKRFRDVASWVHVINFSGCTHWTCARRTFLKMADGSQVLFDSILPCFQHHIFWIFFNSWKLNILHIEWRWFVFAQVRHNIFLLIFYHIFVSTFCINSQLARPCPPSTLMRKDQNMNSPYWLAYVSLNDGSENLVVNQNKIFSWLFSLF